MLYEVGRREAGLRQEADAETEAKQTVRESRPMLSHTSDRRRSANRLNYPFRGTAREYRYGRFGLEVLRSCSKPVA